MPQLCVQQLQAAEGNPGHQALLLQLLKLSLAQAALPQPTGAPQPTVRAPRSASCFRLSMPK